MPRNPTIVTIRLEPQEAAELRAAWNGSGGFQTLGPKLAAKLGADGRLDLEDDELGAIIRHMNYVQSGFRDRVREIFERPLRHLMTHKK
jgi:hypothetical protein